MDKKLIRQASKQFKMPVVSNNLKAALKAFLRGDTTQSGNYVATENALVYRSLSTVDGYIQDVICIRLVQDNKVHYLGNSSRMKVVGTNISFGNRSRSWGETEAQKVLSSMGIAMLPFDSFIQAGLKVTATKILDQSGAEIVKRQTRTDRKGNPVLEKVHFTGASLFVNNEKYFLFDIDREEIKHGIFNPFIVELPNPVKTIKDAYFSLIPDKVHEAKEKGQKVLRQGEHFFIKVATPTAYKPDLRFDQDPFSQNEDEQDYKTARLSVQGNRDHEASRFNEKSGLVSGKIKHWGREHKDLDLSDGWYLPVPNTAARSFTITGDVD